jgi:lipopolysaccharide export system permease protein
VIKKLDKLILKAFIGPFIATFFVTLFVLVMQFFWKYIDDLVGKGLDLISILKLTSYVTVTAIPLALPLAVLLSSIMTFGNLGESFELVAIKSAGIPLLRFMQPLIIISTMICSIAFLISNYVMPVATLKFTTMVYDIRMAKPAFDLKEGIFYDKLPGFAIKVGRKEKEGNSIYDVVIYQSQSPLQDNIIVAEKGVMKLSDDKKFLEFNLENGCSYQEKGPYNTIETDYYRLGFKEYKMSFDLSSFKVLKTPDSLFKTNYRMLNIKQLNYAADSLEDFTKSHFLSRMNREISSYYSAGKMMDSGWTPTKPAPVIPKDVTSYEDILTDSVFNNSYAKASEKINLVKSSADIIASEYKAKREILRRTLIEWHRKFALSFACFVLFMIGAPLGSIIRKGGLGMPLVIAVIFFLVFHLLNMFGEKFVEQEIMTPLGGMWLSTMVLIPIGIFLTYKAMNDSQLFSNEFYFRSFKAFRKKWDLGKKT